VKSEERGKILAQRIFMMRKLSKNFYSRDNVLQIAKELLGKILVTNRHGIITAGRIVECEAYNGVMDRASHAWGGRRTRRNEMMYAEAGTAYVYLCYGIHHLFNVVTNKKDIPHAILIRALEPVKGLEYMLKRRNRKKPDYSVTRGPGSVSEALGITVADNGISLLSKEIYIADDGYAPDKKCIGRSPRIGVEYSGAAAKYKYRFFLKGNLYVSGKKMSR
jgi:DNA-3-methyladenine glycosylase